MHALAFIVTNLRTGETRVLTRRQLDTFFDDRNARDWRIV